MTSCAYYDLTEKNIENKVLLEITNIASTYGKDALDVDILLSILYMAMIAEERNFHAWENALKDWVYINC